MSTKLSAESLALLTMFSKDNGGSFRCNKSQADDLAKAIREALALLAEKSATEA